MRAPNGEDYDASGVYREVILNEKLVLPGLKSTPERWSLKYADFRLTVTAPRSRWCMNFSTTPRDSHNGLMSAMDKLGEHLTA